VLRSRTSERDSGPERKKGKKVPMADDSGGLSANKAAGQEEEGSTVPFCELGVLQKMGSMVGQLIFLVFYELGSASCVKRKTETMREKKRKE
jgi:hypothetical protein